MIRAMAKHLSARRRLRLRRELETIRGAVEAARILGEAVATSQLGPERDHRRAPRALNCLLALVDDRLRDVRRADRKLDAATLPIGEQFGHGTRHIGEQVGAEPRRSPEPEPQHAREQRGDGDHFRRMTPDERVLAFAAMQQRRVGHRRFDRGAA
jgi:hypothetical protein